MFTIARYNSSKECRWPVKSWMQTSATDSSIRAFNDGRGRVDLFKKR